MFGDEIARHKNILALGDENEKTIYLTFDAGYPCDNLTKILDVLKKHSAPGAFFEERSPLRIPPAVSLKVSSPIKNSGLITKKK